MKKKLFLLTAMVLIAFGMSITSYGAEGETKMINEDIQPQTVKTDDEDYGDSEIPTLSEIYATFHLNFLDYDSSSSKNNKDIINKYVKNNGLEFKITIKNTDTDETYHLTFTQDNDFKDEAMLSVGSYEVSSAKLNNKDIDISSDFTVQEMKVTEASPSFGLDVKLYNTAKAYADIDQPENSGNILLNLLKRNYVALIILAALVISYLFIKHKNEKKKLEDSGE